MDLGDFQVPDATDDPIKGVSLGEPLLPSRHTLLVYQVLQVALTMRLVINSTWRAPRTFHLVHRVLTMPDRLSQLLGVLFPRRVTKILCKVPAWISIFVGHFMHIDKI